MDTIESPSCPADDPDVRQCPVQYATPKQQDIGENQPKSAKILNAFQLLTD
jgi:hypothetical protein